MVFPLGFAKVSLMETVDDNDNQAKTAAEESRKSVAKVRSQMERLEEFLELQALRESLRWDSNNSDGQPSSQ
jgi:hypothetical protein